MRRILISIIAISLFYQVFGYILVFNANAVLCKKEMKRAIKAGLKEDDLQVFRLSNIAYENLAWQNKKEFILKKTMYDVVKKEQRGNDSVILYCITDTQETVLFANLTSHIDQNSDLNATGKPISKTLLKLLKIEGLLLKEGYCAFINSIEFDFAKHNPQIVTQISTVSTPPPKQVS